MSIKIVGDPADLQGEAILHHLPCTIESDDVANVSRYFNIKDDNSNGMKTASFRGRPLEGKIIKVADGYVGLVLEEKRKPFCEEQDRTLEVSQKFSEFTQWYLDSQYLSRNGVENSCNTWQDKLSKAIHEPIDVE